jgi:hypothetical protein
VEKRNKKKKKKQKQKIEKEKKSFFERKNKFVPAGQVSQANHQNVVRFFHFVLFGGVGENEKRTKKRGKQKPQTTLQQFLLLCHVVFVCLFQPSFEENAPLISAHLPSRLLFPFLCFSFLPHSGETMQVPPLTEGALRVAITTGQFDGPIVVQVISIKAIVSQQPNMGKRFRFFLCFLNLFFFFSH